MRCTLPFEPCSSICISGQTGSGKTRWVYQFLTHIREMYARDPPTRILYCYGIYQPLFDEMERNVPYFTSKQGLPSAEELDEFTGDRRHKLIVIEDLMHKVVQDKEMELLFTQGTHHRCVSVILITQNLYPGGKHARTIALNTWYTILMKNFKETFRMWVYWVVSYILVEARPS